VTGHPGQFQIQPKLRYRDPPRADNPDRNRLALLPAVRRETGLRRLDRRALGMDRAHNTQAVDNAPCRRETGRGSRRNRCARPVLSSALMGSR
jgi:hypothetical protein